MIPSTVTSFSYNTTTQSQPMFCFSITFFSVYYTVLCCVTIAGKGTNHFDDSGLLTEAITQLKFWMSYNLLQVNYSIFLYI